MPIEPTMSVFYRDAAIARSPCARPDTRQHQLRRIFRFRSSRAIIQLRRVCRGLLWHAIAFAGGVYEDALLAGLGTAYWRRYWSRSRAFTSCTGKAEGLSRHRVRDTRRRRSCRVFPKGSGELESCRRTRRCRPREWSDYRTDRRAAEAFWCLRVGKCGATARLL